MAIKSLEDIIKSTTDDYVNLDATKGWMMYNRRIKITLEVRNRDGAVYCTFYYKDTHTGLFKTKVVKAKGLFIDQLKLFRYFFNDNDEYVKAIFRMFAMFNSKLHDTKER